MCVSGCGGFACFVFFWVGRRWCSVLLLLCFGLVPELYFYGRGAYDCAAPPIGGSILLYFYWFLGLRQVVIRGCSVLCKYPQHHIHGAVGSPRHRSSEGREIWSIFCLGMVSVFEFIGCVFSCFFFSLESLDIAVVVDNWLCYVCAGFKFARMGGVVQWVCFYFCVFMEVSPCFFLDLREPCAVSGVFGGLSGFWLVSFFIPGILVVMCVAVFGCSF